MHDPVLHLWKFFPAIVVLASLALTVWLARRHTASVPQPQTVVRTASLNAAEENERGWWLALLSTLIPLGATASVLATHWQAIPQRFPTHWGLQGVPNGWSHRTVLGVFGPLLFAFALTVGMGLLAALTSRSSPGFAGRSSVIRITRNILIACSWFITLILCAVSLTPLTHTPTRFVHLTVIAGPIFSLAILGYVVLRSRKIAPAIAASYNSTDSRFWKASLFYYNPADPALMVPKRTGLGYTLNFGRPLSWLIFAASILLPLLFVYFIHQSHPH